MKMWIWLLLMYGMTTVHQACPVVPNVNFLHNVCTYTTGLTARPQVSCVLSIVERR